MQKDIGKGETSEAQRRFPQATDTKSISAAKVTNKQKAPTSHSAQQKDKGG